MFFIKKTQKAGKLIKNEKVVDIIIYFLLLSFVRLAQFFIREFLSTKAKGRKG